jgi:hypothetical protein
VQAFRLANLHRERHRMPKFPHRHRHRHRQGHKYLLPPRLQRLKHHWLLEASLHLFERPKLLHQVDQQLQKIRMGLLLLVATAPSQNRVWSSKQSWHSLLLFTNVLRPIAALNGCLVDRILHWLTGWLVGWLVG